MRKATPGTPATPETPDNLALRDSEMARLLRAFDWPATPLGPIASWPPCLRIAVGICLNSRFPMFVWWGPQLINIYNDAYIPVLGKRHPDAFGKPARPTWHEIWDVVGPQAEAVMRTGQATWNERVLLVMERHGYTEDTWFTWSYSAIPDEAGGIGGLFCACTEDTPRVLAERERDRLDEVVRRSEERFRALINASSDVVYRMSPDWREMRQLRGREFLADTSEPDRAWIDKYIQPDDQPRVWATIREAIRAGGVFELEHRVRRADGTLGWTFSRAIPVRDERGEVIEWFGAASDVTRRKEAEARDKFLLRLDDAVRGLTDPDAVTLSAATLLGEHLEVDRCAYADVEPDEDTMNLTGNYVRHAGIRSIVGRLRFADFGAEVLRLMRENKPFVVNDVDTHRPPVGDPAAYRATQIRAVICVPLHKEGKFVAAMAVHCATPRGWKPEEVELLLHVANRCWESIVLARAQRTLKESEERLKLAVTTGKLGLWTLDLAARELTCSDACKGNFGRRPDERFTYDDLWESIHPDDRDRVFAQVRQAIDRKTDYDTEYRIVWPDGSTHWVLARGRTAYGPDGSPRVMTGVTLDISERKAAEEQRTQLLQSERAARAEAERVNRMKDEFLATLSHELRTPLNAILGWAQVLNRGGHGPDDLAAGLAAIERNARAQTQLIADLLDMSRIISGKVRLDVQRVDPAEVIRAAAETVQAAADARGVRLSLVLDPQAGPISGDPNRLQQVFWNLLSNAIKFTPRQGQVRVALERVNSHLEVRVADTGEGIAPEFLPVVFERFRQADASTTRRHGGLGLGLAIVKHLVELHGGTMRAASAGLGRGATFTVSLPLRAVQAETPEPAERRHPATGGVAMPDTGVRIAGVKVLVVDDEADSRQIVRRLLEECDASVTTAASAAEALERLREDRPDVLVSDIGMPGEDGYALIRKVRELGPDRGGNVPAIALTAYARAEDRTRSLLAGYQMHAAKPVEPAELIAMIASLAGRTGRSD